MIINPQVQEWSFLHRKLRNYRDAGVYVPSSLINLCCMVESGLLNGKSEGLLKRLLEIPVKSEEARESLKYYRVLMFPKLVWYLLDKGEVPDKELIFNKYLKRRNKNKSEPMIFSDNELRELEK